MKKSEEGVRKTVIRYNPKSSALDGVLLAKLDACLIPPSHLLKMLMANYFALQPGGIGLTEEEHALFAELSPRFGRRPPPKKTAEGRPLASSKKHADVAPKESVAENKTKEAVKAHPSGPVIGSGKQSWGPGNLPPCVDMSDFEDFGTQPGQIVNGKDYR